MQSLVNALIGEYRVVDSLGVGGMGEVYRAVHTHLGRVIAIKALSPEMADAQALQRFYSEASIQASLRHPGVAEYLGFYEYQGRPCILMELVDGETLSAIIKRRGALPVDEAARIMGEIASTVAHFHALGVVHRDIKPSNIKINSAGQVKLLDFGIARYQRADRLTRVGAVVGTPSTLAPEQLRGAAVTEATDIWQLGVLFYELLTGRLPFEGESTEVMFSRILSAEYPPVQTVRADVPPQVAAVVARCLCREPEKRYRNGAGLCQALAPSTGLAPAADVPWNRVGWVAAAAVGAILLIAGAIAVGRHFAGVPETSIVSTGTGGTTTADGKSITVDTADGAAVVFRDGVRVGSTPYQVSARSGEQVTLTLKRDGYEDLPVQFEATERKVYTYTLEPRKGP